MNFWEVFGALIRIPIAISARKVRLPPILTIVGGWHFWVPSADPLMRGTPRQQRNRRITPWVNFDSNIYGSTVNFCFALFTN